VVSRVYLEPPYGFTLHPTAMASTALNDIESWLADRFLEAAAARHGSAGSGP
jgi:hypothetical protein